MLVSFNYFKRIPNVTPVFGDMDLANRISRLLHSVDQIYKSPKKRLTLKPKYDPWSVDSYLQRLFTFKYELWSTRPNECEAPVAARNGWSLSDRKDTIVCACCNQAVYQPWVESLCIEARTSLPLKLVFIFILFVFLCLFLRRCADKKIFIRIDKQPFGILSMEVAIL